MKINETPGAPRHVSLSEGKAELCDELAHRRRLELAEGRVDDEDHGLRRLHGALLPDLPARAVRREPLHQLPDAQGMSKVSQTVIFIMVSLVSRRLGDIEHRPNHYIHTGFNSFQMLKRYQKWLKPQYSYWFQQFLDAVNRSSVMKTKV